MPHHPSTRRSALGSARRHLPAALVAGGAILFTVATTRYPGGYSWGGQSVSSLFQPETLEGVRNSARPVAVAAVLAFCLGIGLIFNTIAGRASTRLESKTVQIAGVGSMVYAFLVVTPMHDVMVPIALTFFVVAALAVFYSLWRQERFLLLILGVLCISGTLWNAALYYLTSGSSFLPIVQKGSTVAWVGWVLAVYYVGLGEREGPASTP